MKDCQFGVSPVNYSDSDLNSDIVTGLFNRLTSPDSVNGRASALGAGGRGFDTWPRHTKGVKNGTSAYLAWRSAL